MKNISGFAEDLMLDALMAGERFVSLHTSDPGEAGAGESKESRQRTTFSPAKAGFKASASELLFERTAKAKFTHVGVWDAATGGRFLIGGPLAKTIETYEGDSVRLHAGKLGFAVSNG